MFTTNDYTLGKGIVYFDQLVNSVYQGELDLGNAPSFTFTTGITKLDHYSSRGGLRAKDKTVISEITPTLAFTLDSFNTENLALLTLADTSTITQTAQDDLSASITMTTKDRYYDLGSYKDVGVYKVNYDNLAGGNFAVSDTITGAVGGQTWDILQDVILTATTGILYLTAKVGLTDLVNDEEIDTGGGVTADVNSLTGVVFDTTDLCVSIAGPTFYTQTTDYTVDAENGRIYIPSTSTIAAASTLIVEFGCTANTYTRLNAIANTTITGRLRFVSDNPVGDNLTMLAWSVDLTPSGDTGLIGDDWASLGFDAEILKDETNHPLEPYYRIERDY